MMRTRAVVVLGGGGAKAAAHLGAARALSEAGIEVVHWIGTSMGAVAAAALASGLEPDLVLQRFLRIKAKDILVRRRFAILQGIWARSLFRTGPFRRTIESLLDARTFDELGTPCTVTAVEQQTGREIGFGNRGEPASLIDALTASCALPPWFEPAMVNGRPFYDGGLRAPVPVHLAEGIDCDLVVVVDVGPGFDETDPPVQVPPPLLAASDTAIGWLMAGTTVLLKERWQSSPALPALLWVRPVSDRGATFALDRIEEYARAGHRSMRDALEGLG